MKRQQIAHYLNRHNRLHNPSINRLFYPSAVDSRCRRADLHSREYVGYTQATQGQFEHPFGFALLTEPALSIKSDDVAANAVSNSNIAEDTLKSVISALNKLRPKFIVTIGNMTTYTPESKLYSEGIDTYRRMMARVLDTIPCLYVPGSIDVGYPNITESSLSKYFKSRLVLYIQIMCKFTYYNDNYHSLQYI